MTFVRTWSMAAAVLLLAACASLPPIGQREESHALVDTAGTRLGRSVAADIAAHPGNSGVHNLANARDAFAARGLLANAAEKSIDAEYYIWRDDQSGRMLLDTLWKAAGRGVRVRLLVDDSGTGGLDETFAAFLTNKNFQVRLYNPFASRSAKSGAFVTDFTRVNRRMHNKQFTVDNQFSVIGGRNIGNEYFQLGDDLGFFDADVVVVGPIVQQISASFDEYWNSASAYPAERLIAPVKPDGVAKMEDDFAKARSDPASVQYFEALRTTPLLTDLDEHRAAIEWTTMQFIADDPAKTLDQSGRKDVLLYPQLIRAFQDGKTSLEIVSPYFVPQEETAKKLAALASSGINVRVLTSSLSGSDAAVVHAGYKKHREELVKGGVHLWELKRTGFVATETNKRIGSSSWSSLHAKVYAVDRSRIFVGSYNFDQRSAHLNTEQGLIIDSAALAGGLADMLDKLLPRSAYEVVLTPDKHDLQWIERTESGETRYDTDPQTSWWLRAKVNFMSIFPIDWLL